MKLTPSARAVCARIEAGHRRRYLNEADLFGDRKTLLSDHTIGEGARRARVIGELVRAGLLRPMGGRTYEALGRLAKSNPEPVLYPPPAYEVGGQEGESSS